MAGLLRQQRKALGLTLRDVEERTGQLGQLIPFSTLAKVEKGRCDPGLRRLHLLFKVYGLSFDLAEELLDLEEFSGDWPAVSENPDAAYQEAQRHWKAGDLREGVAHLLALRAYAPADAAARVERQKWLLALAVLLGSLGHYRLSRQLVDELLVEPPQPTLLVPVLVQAAVCWQGLGSGEAALAFLARAETHAESATPRDRAWIYHQQASTLTSLARYEDADIALTRALAEYNAANDNYGQSRALAVRVRIMMEQEDWAGGLAAARAARKHAERHEFARLSLMRTIDIGRALLGVGDKEASIATLNEGLSRSVLSNDNVCRFYAHYYLSKAYAKEDPERTAVERRNAQYYVRFVDEHTPETIEIRGATRSPLATSAHHDTNGARVHSSSKRRKKRKREPD